MKYIRIVKCFTFKLSPQIFLNAKQAGGKAVSHSFFRLNGVLIKLCYGVYAFIYPKMLIFCSQNLDKQVLAKLKYPYENKPLGFSLMFPVLKGMKPPPHSNRKSAAVCLLMAADISNYFKMFFITIAEIRAKKYKELTSRIRLNFNFKLIAADKRLSPFAIHAGDAKL